MASATVTPHDDHRWKVSGGANGDQLFSDLQEAVESARAQVRGAGGGVVQVDYAPGLRDEIRVEAATRPLTAFMAQAFPGAAPGPATAGSDIDALVSAYRDAQTSIDGLADGLEREIGQAALRLEAAEAARRLAGTGRPASEVAKLEALVRTLTGGKKAEWAVKQIDALARRALRDLWKSLADGVAVGVVSFVAGLISVFVLAAQDVGAGLFFFVAGGSAAVVFVLRALQAGSPMVEQAWLHSVSWAEEIGTVADRALSPARALVTQIVGPGASQPFTTKARTRAQIIVWLSWALAVLGAGMIVYGFVEAAGSSTTPTL
jgi:hypothetical protein